MGRSPEVQNKKKSSGVTSREETKTCACKKKKEGCKKQEADAKEKSSSIGGCVQLDPLCDKDVHRHTILQPVTGVQLE